jgi:hypothetical protein
LLSCSVDACFSAAHLGDGACETINDCVEGFEMSPHFVFVAVEGVISQTVEKAEYVGIAVGAMETPELFAVDRYLNPLGEAHPSSYRLVVAVELPGGCHGVPFDWGYARGPSEHWTITPLCCGNVEKSLLNGVNLALDCALA